jgi:hypothetical protein
MLGRRVHG